MNNYVMCSFYLYSLKTCRIHPIKPSLCVTHPPFDLDGRTAIYEESPCHFLKVNKGKIGIKKIPPDLLNVTDLRS